MMRWSIRQLALQSAELRVALAFLLENLISFLLCCLAKKQKRNCLLFFVIGVFLCGFIFFYLPQTLFPPPTSALVMGVWADPFVPTAILGETHFLFPLLLIIYFYLKKATEHNIHKMAVWRLNCEDKKKKHRFSFTHFWFSWLFFLFFTKDGFLTFIPACCFSCPVPPLSPPLSPPTFLSSPLPLPPRQMRGLSWAEAGFTPSHPHCVSCVWCHIHVWPLICMDRHVDWMWGECLRGGQRRGQLAPVPRPQRAEAVAAALRHKTEIKKWKKKNTLSFSPPHPKKKETNSKPGCVCLNIWTSKSLLH